MPQVCVTQRIFPEAIELLEAENISYTYQENDQALGPQDLKEAVKACEGLICLITDKVDSNLMEHAPNLKVIANVAVGYDNIDVDAASERGIVVTNTPDVLTETTADLTFALLLAAARRIPEADAYMRSGQFKEFKLYQPQIGVDVYGKTLGIVGMGRIGTAVARRGALGFGMNVLYTANSPKPDAEKEFGARQVTFEEILKESDFISIHTPSTPETHHMFTMDEFQKMKPTAFLINVARGPIVKEDDLAEALESGLIQGAGIDVFEREPLIDPKLAQLKKHVVVAPHIGSASVETRRNMSLMAARNVVAALQGQCPPNALNPEVWAS